MANDYVKVFCRQTDWQKTVFPQSIDDGGI